MAKANRNKSATAATAPTALTPSEQAGLETLRKEAEAKAQARAKREAEAREAKEAKEAEAQAREQLRQEQFRLAREEAKAKEAERADKARSATEAYRAKVETEKIAARQRLEAAIGRFGLGEEAKRVFVADFTLATAKVKDIAKLEEVETEIRTTVRELGRELREAPIKAKAAMKAAQDEINRARKVKEAAKRAERSELLKQLFHVAPKEVFAKASGVSVDELKKLIEQYAPTTAPTEVQIAKAS